MIDDTESDLDKPYLEYNLLFICILLIIYENQGCRTFRFGHMDMSMVIIDSLLPNFVDSNECIDAIFLLDDEVFVVEAFLQYIKEDDEFLV